MFKNNFTLENLPEKIEYSFTPMRIVMKNDDLFNELTTLQVDQKIQHKYNLIIENLFGLNEICPNGVDGPLNDELGKTFAFLDTFQIIFGFINQWLEKDKVYDLFEDIRLSMQHFLYSMLNGSYYSAFILYRKIIEGGLWIEELFWNKGVISSDNRIDTKKSYTKRLEQYPNTKNFFKELSKMIHAEKCVIFNDYKEDRDYLKDFIELTQKCYDEIYNLYHKIFEINWIKNNEVMHRFKKFYFILLDIRKGYDLEDKVVSKSFNNKLIAETEKMNKLLKGNKYKKNLAKQYYLNYLNDHLRNNPLRLFNLGTKKLSEERLEHEKKQIIYLFKHLLSKIKNKKLEESINFIIDYYDIFRLKNWKTILSISWNIPREGKKQIEILKNLLADLVFYTSYFDNDFYSEIRLVLEDLIFNIMIGQRADIATWNMLIHLMCKYDSTIIMPEIIKYKHIIIEEKINSENEKDKAVEINKTRKKEWETLVKFLSDFVKNLKQHVNSK